MFVVAGRCHGWVGTEFPLSHDSGRQPQTYVKPEAAITVFELLMMSGVSLETCWAIKRHWNNKFYYTVASFWFPLSHDTCRQTQTYVKPEASITVFELLMMSGVSLKTCWAIKRHWNNKFYYTVASFWACWAIKKHSNNKFYYMFASCWLFL
jgi:predicted DCC family thiol-disulfide oxidoreductase YuxK